MHRSASGQLAIGGTRSSVSDVSTTKEPTLEWIYIMKYFSIGDLQNFMSLLLVKYREYRKLTRPCRFEHQFLVDSNDSLPLLNKCNVLTNPDPYRSSHFV